jgi:hypothetical protein
VGTVPSRNPRGTGSQRRFAITPGKLSADRVGSGEGRPNPDDSCAGDHRELLISLPLIEPATFLSSYPRRSNSSSTSRQPGRVDEAIE